ncbi:MAG: sigma-70 family RNA polymerase sigma factor [Acidobacteriota bacterium]
MSLTKEDFTAADLARALDGDPRLLEELIDRLTPVIQVRAARTLVRRLPSASPERLRDEVEDLVQEVMMSLFADDARVLRNWDPDRGMSLQNYVGLVAERLVFSVVQSRKKTWPAEFRTHEQLDRPAADRDPEARFAARQALGQMVERLRGTLSPQGFEIFVLLFVEELTVEDVRARTGLSADAVYAWRSRLRRTTRSLMHEMPSRPTDSVGVEG